ncbi:LysR family transcriptional regulator [Streptosporangium sp. NPDC000396]|uniref:LysR family transcriptional regulator n=1 Tax=Streptosporangium sp. NPDC000396 TaxID=3366185 RepID=UPI0036AFF363
MFDSRQVRVFAEVVHTGSYSAAARSLGYTPPAISQQMKALERAVGTPLFVRVGRGLRLTDAGEVLARHASGILGSISAAQKQMTAIKRLKAGRVRICAFPSASATLVPAAASLITKDHPGIRIELTEQEPPLSLEALCRGDCDIALAFSYGDAPEQPAEEVLEIPLLDDPLVVLMPAGHPLARRRSVELRQLADERWIAGCVRCRGHFVKTCAEAGFEPDIAFTTDDNLAVQGLVAAGFGVSLMPELVLSFMRHPKVAGRPLNPAAHRRVSAYTLPGHQEIPVVGLLLEALRSASDQSRHRRRTPRKPQPHT